MKGTDLLAWKKRLITGVFKYKYVLLVILVGCGFTAASAAVGREGGGRRERLSDNKAG